MGFHESLIALAPIVAPALCGWLGVQGTVPLIIGGVFVLMSAVPLVWAEEDALSVVDQALPKVPMGRTWGLPKEPIFLMGVVVALLGGMAESAFAGLFSVYGRALELTATEIASLLLSFGIGGLLLQYLAGWLADHRGVAFACLSCSLGGVGVSVLLTFPLGPLMLHTAVFALGGLVTAYLTLALIASAKTASGNLARNMSVVSMVYTATAIVGPLLAGSAIRLLGGGGLMWTLAALALLMSGWLAMIVLRDRRHSPSNQPA